MKVHSARRVNANLPVKSTPNSTHHQKLITYPNISNPPELVDGNGVWMMVMINDDACLRFTKTIQILQERMGDRSRERETNVELV